MERNPKPKRKNLILKPIKFGKQQFNNNMVAAETDLVEALALYREAGDRRGEAWSLQNLATISFFQGDAPEAEERLGLARSMGYADVERFEAALAGHRDLGIHSGLLNDAAMRLIQSGVARRGSVTDLSPGMVKVATRNGQNLGLDVDGRVADGVADDVASLVAELLHAPMTATAANATTPVATVLVLFTVLFTKIPLFGPKVGSPSSLLRRNRAVLVVL